MLVQTGTLSYDSGATGTFVTSSDAQLLLAKTPVSSGTSVLSANGTAMPITVQGQLPLSKKLSSAAQAAFVLDDLKISTLISLAQLCDDDCIAIFNIYDVKIMKSDEVIIQGSSMPNGLWSLPLLASSAHQANRILRTDKPNQNSLSIFMLLSAAQLLPRCFEPYVVVILLPC